MLVNTHRKPKKKKKENCFNSPRVSIKREKKKKKTKHLTSFCEFFFCTLIDRIENRILRLENVFSHALVKQKQQNKKIYTSVLAEEE